MALNDTRDRKLPGMFGGNHGKAGSNQSPSGSVHAMAMAHAVEALKKAAHDMEGMRLAKHMSEGDSAPEKAAVDDEGLEATGNVKDSPAEEMSEMATQPKGTASLDEEQKKRLHKALAKPGAR